MSCYFAIRFDDRVELMSDGAVVDADGRFIRDKNKVDVAFALPIAVTGVGEEADIEAMKDVVLTAAFALESVDDVLDLLREELPQFEPTQGESALLIAAVSETQGPLLLTYKNTESQLVNRGDSHAFGPPLDNAEMMATGVDFSFPDGLRTDGVRLLQAMRRKRCEPFGLPQGHYVGGHVDWTVVNAEGARVERVLDWSDLPGERITPNQEDS